MAYLCISMYPYIVYFSESDYNNLRGQIALRVIFLGNDILSQESRLELSSWFEQFTSKLRKWLLFARLYFFLLDSPTFEEFLRVLTLEALKYNSDNRRLEDALRGESWSGTLKTLNL